MTTRTGFFCEATIAAPISRRRASRAWFGVAASSLLWCGCGADTAEVNGTVKVDGKPMAGLQVEFAPADRGGERQLPAYGTTQNDGKYTLTMKGGKRGAVIGQHTVRVINIEGGAIRSGGKIVPPVEISHDVKAGPNVIDIDLKSK